jgi:ketosteroid isomerase-like protein
MTTTDTNTATTREVVQAFFQRLAAREPEPIADLFASEIDWLVPGDQTVAPWLGRRQARQDVVDFYRLLFESVEPIGAELQHLLVDGEVAIATGEFASRMRRTGKIVESPFAVDFTVRNGRIVRLRLLEDSQAVVRALTP